MHVVVLQESLLLEPMFEVPGSDITQVVIDGEVVKGTKKPVYVQSTGRIEVDTPENKAQAAGN